MNYHRALGMYRTYGARPEPITDERRRRLADALDELARLVRDGTAAGGMAKAWPSTDPARYAAVQVTEDARKCVIVGVALDDLPPACARAATLFAGRVTPDTR